MAKSAPEKKKQENRIVEYFRETWFELKKVSWPTRAEALNLTGIVILVTTFLAIVLALMDYVFEQLLGLLLG